MMRRPPRTANTIAAALLYMRVSGREQEREGLSLPAKLPDSQRYARDRGWIIGGTYQDVMTGTRDDRPQYQSMLADIRRLRMEGQNVVSVVKWLHRFGRKVHEIRALPRRTKDAARARTQ
jgi:DNA invertase Pin-like site-specific DNA recombinase